MKTRRPKQVEASQRRAVLAAQYLLEDNDRADEIESMKPGEYTELREIKIVGNPKCNNHEKGEFSMATLKELRKELRDKNDYIQELEDKLSEISGISAIVDVDEDEDLINEEDED